MTGKTAGSLCRLTQMTTSARPRRHDSSMKILEGLHRPTAKKRRSQDNTAVFDSGDLAILMKKNRGGGGNCLTYLTNGNHSRDDVLYICIWKRSNTEAQLFNYFLSSWCFCRDGHAVWMMKHIWTSPRAAGFVDCKRLLFFLKKQHILPKHSFQSPYARTHTPVTQHLYVTIGTLLTMSAIFFKTLLTLAFISWLDTYVTQFFFFLFYYYYYYYYEPKKICQTK